MDSGSLTYQDLHKMVIDLQLEVDYLKKQRPPPQENFDDYDEKITSLDFSHLFAIAIEQVREPFEITDINGDLIYVNTAFETLTGYRREEVIGRNMNILSSGKHNESFFQEMWATLKSGKNWQGIFINRHKNGAIYEVETSITPIVNTSGIVTHFIGMRRDISERQKIENQLLRAQKMEAIGTLAGGIAHDFNNILAAILGYTELTLLQEGVKDGKIHKNLNEILKAGTRAKNMISQILTYSRGSKFKLSSVQPANIIEETLKMLRPTVPANIEFKFELSTKAQILADASQIQQLVMNMCTNAFHAMAENETGVLKVSLGEVLLEESDIEQYPNLHPGNYVQLVISDTGSGMDTFTQNRIFDPYFSTKDIGIGTGLGLSVVLGIVRNNNGHISVSSEPGQGSTFTVLFPFTTEKEKSEQVESEVIPCGNECILLVDDEAMLVDIGQKMLQTQGYNVITCTSSLDALKSFRTNPNKFDLVISDYSMPIMTGTTLVAEIRKIRAEIPIIISSGYTESTSKIMDELKNIDGFLPKPYNLKSIAKLVRKAIDNKDETPVA